MSIEEILTHSHFVLKPTTKWVAVNDPRPSFKKAFGTPRFGKLQESALYVTLDLVKNECESLIVASGLPLRHLRSTSGRGKVYPGFDTNGVPETALAGLVNALRSKVESYL